MIRQSSAAKRQTTPPTGYVSGSIMAAILTVELANQPYAVGDLLEFGVLPADTRPIRMAVLPESVGTPSLTLGLLSGEPGDTEGERVLSEDFLPATALVNNQPTHVPMKTLLDLPVGRDHRAIGGKLNAAQARGAGKRITILVEYVHV